MLSQIKVYLAVQLAGSFGVRANTFSSINAKMAELIAAEVEKLKADVAASVAGGAEASDEPIANPLSIVVFGATGDLAREKLYPSFQQLMLKGLLPYGSTIMACVPPPHFLPSPAPRRSRLRRRCIY